MDYRLNIKNLENPEDVSRLIRAIQQIADECDTLIASQSPNGNIPARRGRLAHYVNGVTNEVWMNTDGGTTWIQIY